MAKSKSCVHENEIECDNSEKKTSVWKELKNLHESKMRVDENERIFAQIRRENLYFKSNPWKLLDQEYLLFLEVN